MSPEDLERDSLIQAVGNGASTNSDVALDNGNGHAERVDAYPLEEQRREAGQLEEQGGEVERLEEEGSAGGQHSPTEATALKVAWARLHSEASSLFRDLAGKKDLVRQLRQFEDNPTAYLAKAAKFGNIHDVKVLLGLYNADINGFLDYKGSKYTPLMLAVVRGQYDVTKLLLELGANVNVQSEPEQETALMMAAHTSDIEQLLLLLEHGGNNLDLKDKSGQTALDHLDSKLEILKSTSLFYRPIPGSVSHADKVYAEYNELSAAVAKAKARASQSESQI